MSTIANDVARCSGDNCPSRNNCRRYTDRSTAGNMTPHAAFWARREAGTSASDMYLPIEVVSTFSKES